ncbi:hypothetical protein [Methylophaga sp.]|uniref:hypothetical protein n=1 Tax=Methylophaga sp. TaxID=2024840 RepID=UPI003F69868D
MKPQVTIEQKRSNDRARFIIKKEVDNQVSEVDQAFDSYQQALDFVLNQGWQLKREPIDTLHVETRFLKP